MKLKVGDIRQDGDEQRAKPFSSFRAMSAGGYDHNDNYCAPEIKEFGSPVCSSWDQVSLVGHPILASDLMHLEFRRGE